MCREQFISSSLSIFSTTTKGDSVAGDGEGQPLAAPCRKLLPEHFGELQRTWR